MKPLAPKDLLDAYGPGVNVVVLTTDDDLGAEARLVAHRLSQRFGRYVTLWDCRLRTPEDTAEVECCRVPQYRFVVDGSERTSHLGVLDDEALIEKIGEL